MTSLSAEATPFRMEVFRGYAEFAQYLQTSDAQRGARWLYERSLASSAAAVVLQGTCGPCLKPTRFTAPTQGGEPALAGRVPNWREGLACACEHRLIGRERALLHYLLAGSLLRPWTRILALGEVRALRPALTELSGHVACRYGPLDAVLAQVAAPRGGYHLIVSVEQLTAHLARPDVFGALAGLLAPGGAALFTAPFAIEPTNDSKGGPVGWGVLNALAEGGLTAARVCTYWSEELGYLGAFNMIVAASKP